MDKKEIKKVIRKKIIEGMSIDDVFLINCKNCVVVYYHAKDISYFQKVTLKEHDTTLATYHVVSDEKGGSLEKIDDFIFPKSVKISTAQTLDIRDVFNSARTIIDKNSNLLEYFKDLDEMLLKISSNKIILESADDRSLLVSHAVIDYDGEPKRFFIKKSLLKAIVECLNIFKDDSLEIRLADSYLIFETKIDKMMIKIEKAPDKTSFYEMEQSIQAQRFSSKVEASTDVYIDKKTKEKFFKVGPFSLLVKQVRALEKLTNTVFLSENENFYQINGSYFTLFTCKPIHIVDEIMETNGELDDEEELETDEIDERHIIDYQD